jgi:ribosomal protein L29
MKLNSMLHIAQARTLGFTVDESAAGRPVAYKGSRVQPDEWADCYTELETGMIARINTSQSEREQWEHQHKAAAAKCEEHETEITRLQGSLDLSRDRIAQLETQVVEKEAELLALRGPAE